MPSLHARYVICQSQMAITVDNEFADPEYIFQFLNSAFFLRYIEGSVIQTGQPHINLEILREERLRCPRIPSSARWQRSCEHGMRQSTFMTRWLIALKSCIRP